MGRKRKNIVRLPRKRYRVNRYNVFQSELKLYLSERSLVPGVSFRELSKKLYSYLDKSVPLKYIGESIHSLYLKYSGERGSKNIYDYEEDFPFYEAVSTFSSPVYSSSLLTVTFDDGGHSFEYSGLSSEFKLWFTLSGNLSYLRNNYNNSPVAYFRLLDSSSDSVSYVVEVESSKYGSDEYIEPSAPVEVRDKSYRDKKSVGVLEKEIELERVKQQTLDKRIEYVRLLKESGFSASDIQAELKRIGL